jgi:uncharacterized protein
MPYIKKIVLDVLKPHQPTILEVAQVLVEANSPSTVNINVAELDEQTETLIITIKGKDIDLDAVARKINDLGGSVHSVDEVEVSTE